MDQSSEEKSTEESTQHDRMIRPIGIIRSCFGEKFGTPRQPGLVADSWAELEFSEEFRNPDLLRGTEGFSHVWLIFGFHKTTDRGWQATVRPPRLGGNQRVGTFASRSTFRPNGLGLSVAKLAGIKNRNNQGTALQLSGIDLIDGTPIYDVKPYLAYADSIPDARDGFASGPIPRLEVAVLASAQAAFDQLEERSQRVISASLSLDPRPSTAAEDPARIYGATLCGRNIRFRIAGKKCEIVEVVTI